MPQYQLFAARDGDTLEAASVQPSMDAAEEWASNRIVQRFALQWYAFDEFYELVAETDSVILREAETFGSLGFC